jgi:signal peptidase II
MAEALRKGLMLWGGMARPAAAYGLAILVADQLSKLAVLHVLQPGQGIIPVTPFMDIVLLWNRGVSYSLFPMGAQWPLVVMSLAVSTVLWSWACRTQRRLTAIALGLIIGGALGNALDRVVHGAVADFVHLHWGSFSWYVFNIADCAIVAGVALLLYESWRESGDRQGLGNA